MLPMPCTFAFVARSEASVVETNNIFLVLGSALPLESVKPFHELLCIPVHLATQHHVKMS